MLLEIIRGTPLWVWGVLLFLLWAGWRQRQDRVVLRRHALLLSGILFLWSSSSVGTLSGWSSLASLAWIAGVLAGYVAAKHHFGASAVQAMPEKHLVRIRGSYLPLAAFVLIFVVHYVSGVSRAMGLHLDEMLLFIGVCSVVIGVVGGMLLVRLVALWRL